MPGESELSARKRKRRKELRLMIVGLLVLGALVALSIWVALTTNYDERWPPPTID